MDKVQIVHVKVNEMPEIKTIKTDLKTLQSLVGGHLEAIFISPEIMMYLHGEGKIIGLEENFAFLTHNGDSLRVGDMIVGDVFFAAHDHEGEMISLTENMIENIMNRFMDRHAFIGRTRR